MTYEEKGVWAYPLASAGAYAAYLAIVGPRLVRTPAADVSYLVPLLVTTLASIGGFIGARNRWDYFWTANVIYLGFVPWAVAGSVVRLVACRRGL